MNIKPTSEFPLLEKYKERFNPPPTVAYPYGDTIYTDNHLPEYLVIHEQEHLKQQKEYGLDTWIDRYFNEDKFRLDMEVRAFRKQLASVKNREDRNGMRIEYAKSLSSELYGNIISFENAILCLK